MAIASLFRRYGTAAPSWIDDWLGSHLQGHAKPTFGVTASSYPSFRFVDIYRAVESFVDREGAIATIESEHNEDLNGILHGKRQEWTPRRIKRSTNVSWPLSVDDEVFLPVDRFWVCNANDGNERVVIRVRLDTFQNKVTIETASRDVAVAQDSLNWIVTQSIEESIFRRKMIELAYEPGRRDDEGDVESIERLRVLFKREDPVSDEDIVIDTSIQDLLRRNVIDLHDRRDILKAHQVPVRRGVLLYGPPGTGKTFACRYLCSKLPQTTRIVVTGTALLQVNSIFSLARLLAPALLILEDVDLVFASRDINLYSSALGDLLDQMDGLRSHEEVGFVMTTNSIDRMEAAIRDRPGRISQCIYFGAPDVPLRTRYIERYLRDQPTQDVDLADLVARSDGATPAFLKEWVFRSIQIACERLTEASDPLTLSNNDFHRAMDEMKRFSEGSTGKIIGFQGG